MLRNLSQRLRIAALRYLAILPSLVRYDVLHPQKALVVRDLAKVLDDPKKAVRKEAVEARTNWYVSPSPNVVVVSLKDAQVQVHRLNARV